MQLAGGGGVEWGQGGVGGLDAAGCVGKGAECVLLRGDKGVGVNRLPNREQTIDVSAISVNRVNDVI